MTYCQPVKIKENIYWVGGIDWDLRNFHGYLTQRGSTYNAYLIIDEKITLVDTVKHYLADEMISRISQIVDPSKIDYVVSNHTEMDHSGALPVIMGMATNAQVITSPNGQKGLKAHYKKDWNFKIMKSGDTLKLGKYSLNFVLTPMVHWPDNMVAYMPEENILFSNDAFGQHIASRERFEEEYQLDIILQEAKKYYANIVLPYSQQVQNALKSLAGLKLDAIAPSHGIIWRSSIEKLLKEYDVWSSNATQRRAIIIYDTMWNSTKKLAYAIAGAFEAKCISTSFFSLQNNHISDIMTEVISSEFICVGSPTLNNNILPTVAGFLTYLKGLAPKNRTALAFGSYGWGGQSVGIIEETFKSCGFKMLNSIKTQYIPDWDALCEIADKLEEQLDADK